MSDRALRYVTCTEIAAHLAAQEPALLGQISSLVQKCSASSDATIARHGSVTLKVLKSVGVVESGKHEGAVAGEVRVLTDVGNRIDNVPSIAEHKGGAGLEFGRVDGRGGAYQSSDRMRDLQKEVKQKLHANMQSLQNRVTAANLKAI